MTSPLLLRVGLDPRPRRAFLIQVSARRRSAGRAVEPTFVLGLQRIGTRTGRGLVQHRSRGAPIRVLGVRQKGPPVERVSGLHAVLAEEEPVVRCEQYVRVVQLTGGS